MGKGATLINALIGAIVTVVLSFTGFSPIIGGAVAGYLQRESRRGCAKVGALSGAIAFVPFLLFIFLFFGVMFGGIGGRMGIPGGPELLVIIFIMFPMFLVWNIGLGALGGYLAAYLREDLQESSQ